MSMPAGWYDDGSGRQRWWDGTSWSEHVALGHGVPSAAARPPSAPGAGGYVTGAQGRPSSAERVAPILGYVGLGLAVLGTLLACIPVTFVFGAVVLIAAFVVSLIGVFKKNAAKWPSIVGMVLSVIGGAIGTVVTLVIVAATLVGPTDSASPTVIPSPSISEEPSSEPSLDEERPSADALGVAFLADLQRTGITDYDDDPEFISCWGEFVYASQLSDEALREYIDTLTITGSEAELMTTVSTNATVSCSTP